MKKIIAVFIILSILMMSGCSKSNHSNYNEEKIINNGLLTVISTLNANEQKKVLSRERKFDSENTIVYKNDDGTYDFWVFGSPVMFRSNNKWKLISNNVVESDKKGYAFENEANSIKTYFPLNLKDSFLVKEGRNEINFKIAEKIDDIDNGIITVFTNMHGDKVSAVCYKGTDVSYYFYPSKAGIHFEVINNKKESIDTLKFIVNPYGKLSETGERGYVTFDRNKSRQSIIYAPIITDEQGINVNGSVNCEKSEDSYLVSFNSENNQKALKMEAAFEVYYVTIPDSSVYSKFNTNSYLRNIALVGNHNLLGEGWEYMRIGMPAILTTKNKNLISAKLYLQLLGIENLESEYCLYDMNEGWQSAKITWSDKKTNCSFYSQQKSQNGILTFDLTNFLLKKNSYTYDEEASNGLLLKQTSSGFTVFATSDNVLYPTVYKYCLSDVY